MNESDNPYRSPVDASRDDDTQELLCSDCGKILTALNRAHGTPKPQCATCYRKRNDLLSNIIKTLREANWQKRVLIGVALLITSLFAFGATVALDRGGTFNNDGTIAYILCIIGILTLLILGIAFVSSGLKKRTLEPEQAPVKSGIEVRIQRERVASWIGLVATLVPGLIVSGFIPRINVLPVEGWIAVATIGSAIAGAVATPLVLRGAISGAIAGVGMMAGIWLYVFLRSVLIQSNTFFNIELVIGGLLGAAPGLILYKTWARHPRT